MAGRRHHRAVGQVAVAMTHPVRDIAVVLASLPAIAIFTAAATTLWCERWLRRTSGSED